MSETSLTYTTTWDTPVTMPVTLIVSNKHNALSKNFTLNVVYPINGISIDTANVTSEANVPVKLRILYADSIDEPMGGVNYTVNWGDSTDPEGTLTIVTNSYTEVEHTYSVQGDYEITVTLTTPADSKMFTIPTFIWDKLYVVMSIAPLFGKPGDEFTVSITNPPTEGFQYRVIYGQGVLSNRRSDLYLNYTQPDSTALTFSYTSLGTYNVFMKAFNPAYQVLTNQIVIIGHPLTVDTFTMTSAYHVIPVPDGFISIRVAVIEGLVGDVDCDWDFGAVGGTMDTVTLSLALDFPLVKTFTYTDPGTYSVNFHCSNLISSVTVTLNITAKTWEITDKIRGLIQPD